MRAFVVLIALVLFVAWGGQSSAGKILDEKRLALLNMIHKFDIYRMQLNNKQLRHSQQLFLVHKDFKTKIPQ